MIKNTHFILKDGIEQIIPFTEKEEIEKAKSDLEYEWETIKVKRNRLLTESDILVLPDRWASYTPEKQKVISNYRQALRDLPQTITDPYKVNWPVKPE